MYQVLISVPNTGWIHKLVSRQVMRIMQDSRVRCTYIDPTHRPYEHSLNRIAHDAIEQEYDFWLNIDADNPPMNNPIDLCFMGLDVVGLPTPVFANFGNGQSPVYWNAMDAVDDEGWKPHYPQEGLQEVDAVGSGCMMIRVDALRELETPYFVRTVDERGFVEFGPDYNFCRKIKAIGGKIYAHYDYPCEHIQNLPLTEMVKAMEAVL